jgi:oligosaccharyltransferase complex subunit delta (ribophorin II)
VHHKEHISLSFSVVDSVSKAAMSVHQAFVCLTHLASGSEIHYVAEAGMDKNYKFDLDLNTAAADFNSKAGDYSVSIILGDAVIANPTSWAAAIVSVDFPELEEEEAAGHYDVKPEIRHTFRCGVQSFTTESPFGRAVP